MTRWTRTRFRTRFRPGGAWLAAVVVAAGLAAALPGANAAPRQTPCSQRDALVTWLEETFGERRTAFGLSSSGALIELFVARSGTWTMVLTLPNGVTCIIDAGDTWQDIERAGHEGPAV